jgi:hypothetical protein
MTHIAAKILESIPLGVFLVATIGCGGSNRAAVTGQVTLDRLPVDGGTISFIPVDGENRSPGWSEIKEGRYSIAAKAGPTAGVQRVEIHWNKKTGRKTRALPPSRGEIDEIAETIPARYNNLSELKAELKPGQNQADFELNSK